MSNYKLLVLDVDGTIVKDNSQNISEAVVNSIKNLEGKVEVILCTGRSLEDLDKIFPLLDLENNYHVVESGARVLAPGLKTEFVKDIPKQDALELIAHSKSVSKKYSFCAEGIWDFDIENVKDGEFITALTFYCDTPEKADIAMDHFKDFFDKYHINITSNWGKSKW